MPERMTRFAARLACLLAPTLFACAPTPTRNLDELIVQDSTYLDPVSMLPYSGRVVRHFPGERQCLAAGGQPAERHLGR